MSETDDIAAEIDRLTGELNSIAHACKHQRGLTGWMVYAAIARSALELHRSLYRGNSDLTVRRLREALDQIVTLCGDHQSQSAREPIERVIHNALMGGLQNGT